MAARACPFVAAMVDEYDDTIECRTQRIAAFHIRGHIFIGAFGPGQRPVQRVECDRGRFDIAKRGTDRRD